jgi:hypothetical protein
MISEKTGKPCGCQKRKEQLNKLHRKIIKNSQPPSE